MKVIEWPNTCGQWAQWAQWAPHLLARADQSLRTAMDGNGLLTKIGQRLLTRSFTIPKPFQPETNQISSFPSLFSFRSLDPTFANDRLVASRSGTLCRHTCSSSSRTILRSASSQPRENLRGETRKSTAAKSFRSGPKVVHSLVTGPKWEPRTAVANPPNTAKLPER